MIRQKPVGTTRRRLAALTERSLRSSQTAMRCGTTVQNAGPQATGDRTRSQWTFLNNLGPYLPCSPFS